MIKFLLFASAIAVVAGLQCPKQTDGTIKSNPGAKTDIVFFNHFDEPLSLIWLDFGGVEQDTGMLNPGSETRGTYVGHWFRVRTFDGILVMEHEVSELKSRVDVNKCDMPADRKQVLHPEGRDVEFEGLIDKTPFTCEGPSAKWSCVRRLSKEAYEARDRTKYGFTADEVRGSRQVHQTIDDSYVRHIPTIPKLSQGFLKMNMTSVMREALLSFYEEKKHLATVHETIGGDYSNIHKVGMTKIDLDSYRSTRKKVVDEMLHVAQWWTQRLLKHTSTFGVRIYKRDSMLINHVDRADTHLASAVLQVAQEGVEEGWPLEVLMNDGTTLEVYLQPGEMVLYEGARLFHGRPMRFKGDSFANVFSHFAPLKFSLKNTWVDPLSPAKHMEGPQHEAHNEL